MKRLAPALIVLIALSACTPSPVGIRNAPLHSVRPVMVSESAAASLALDSREGGSGELVARSYFVSSSELRVVSPHATPPRLIWNVVVEKRDAGYHNSVWVDAATGSTSWVPLD
jgi:hypothetical protein